MMQELFNIARDLASSIFLITGIAGMLFVPGYLAYWLMNSAYKRGKALFYIFEYMRHRKTFKKWRESQKGSKIRPVSKPQILKEDDHE